MPPRSRTRPQIDCATPSRPSRAASRQPSVGDARAVVAHGHGDGVRLVLDEQPGVGPGVLPGVVDGRPDRRRQLARPSTGEQHRRGGRGEVDVAAGRQQGPQVDLTARQQLRPSADEQPAQRCLLVGGQRGELGVRRAPRHQGERLQHAVVDRPRQALALGRGGLQRRPPRRTRPAPGARAARRSPRRRRAAAAGPGCSPSPATRRPGRARRSCRRPRLRRPRRASPTTPPRRAPAPPPSSPSPSGRRPGCARST